MPYPVTAVRRPSRPESPVRPTLGPGRQAVTRDSMHLGHSPGVGVVCDAFSHSAGARETINAHLDDVRYWRRVAHDTTRTVQTALNRKRSVTRRVWGGGGSGWNWTRVKTVPSARDRGCRCHSTLFAEGETGVGAPVPPVCLRNALALFITPSKPDGLESPVDAGRVLNSNVDLRT
ncbi:hypothetical protein EVAR_39502_1 [Eumeta japonica]|uniref:Uncharacterized protein n=1 Tax=Eumeta variegata TaxID=151549 RepID=A0A4C1W070_EUMVA|nr:hypothetical protein EVAR_39502_1 [Eumeta japonica]